MTGEFERRSLLMGGVAAALVPGASRAAKGAVRHFDRTAYDRYIGLMNAGDPRFIEYYADDVQFVMGIRGKENVRRFYARQQPYVTERLEVLFFCADRHGAASQVNSEIRCIRDCEDPAIFGRALRAGEVQRVRGCLLYELNARGLIAEVKGPPPETLEAWHIEPA